MFASLVLTAILAGAAFVRADPTPTAPGPGNVFTSGGECSVEWEADKTGVWTAMNIELMAGNNEQMQFLETVGTVDATTTTSYTYTCPDVSPNAQIYFYQFTSPFSKNPYWTGRFVIADASGATVAPTATEVFGSTTVLWGSGSVVGLAASSPPAYGESVSGASSSSASPSASPSASFSTSSSAPTSSAVDTSSSSAPTPSATSSSTVSSPTAVSSSASSSAPPSSSPSGMSTSTTSTSTVTPTASQTAGVGAASNGALGALKVNGHVLSAAIGLGVAALTFSVAL
ncbi:hypothetical protein WOLCODRAFT_165208 [Wolfiporia cocos MD-104 SS10]|uniref:Yeast cell wall synthesis Kre9/Knh1-like N-terminal domain-containing protein n=1 Tax=Wolfiporia cocos (strain MD-104) TaxID=742152 RepID=A0A2H3JSQ2_WOLCO|nr:hypothetical protein WOLCODRAFT_165208 [Wolfiporia cocos MD-104 SS10]